MKAAVTEHGSANDGKQCARAGTEEFLKEKGFEPILIEFANYISYDAAGLILGCVT